MQKTTLALAFLLPSFAISAAPITLKPYTPFCMSKELLSELTGAMNRKDTETIKAILFNGEGCLMTSKEFKGNRLDYSAFGGWSKVRIIAPDGNSLVGYTVNESIIREEK